LIAMLREIPRDPQRKTTSQIAHALHQHNIHVRSVQRDLIKLSRDFPFTYDRRGKTFHWYWPAYTKVLDLPTMDVPAALAFLLSREHLNPLLAPATLKLLGPYFNRAEEVLKETPGALGAWRDRVCVVSRGPRLQNPKIADGVQHEVYEAVLAGKQLKVDYAARNGHASKEQVLHPWGIVVYDGVLYLIATAGDYKDPVTWTLHRMKSCKCLADGAERPQEFKLPEYARKLFRFPLSDESFKLVARFKPEVAKHLEERPLSDDQDCKHVNGHVEVSATVADTDDLRWWLLGFGEHVEVVKPGKLRNEMRRRASELARRYSS
jgi:predicted DNA-binding transcriptional regulator YafY